VLSANYKEVQSIQRNLINDKLEFEDKLDKRCENYSKRLDKIEKKIDSASKSNSKVSFSLENEKPFSLENEKQFSLENNYLENNYLENNEENNKLLIWKILSKQNQLLSDNKPTNEIKDKLMDSCRTLIEILISKVSIQNSKMLDILLKQCDILKSNNNIHNYLDKLIYNYEQLAIISKD
jgi:hypothetical protein